MNTAKFYQFSLPLVMALVLCGVARADWLVDYSIQSETGDSWSGQFQANDNHGAGGGFVRDWWNTVGVAGGAYNPVTVTSYENKFDGWMSWSGALGGLQLQSEFLFNSIFFGNALWNDLIGHTYSIVATSDSLYNTEFTDPFGVVRYSGTGGSITFSDGGSGSFINPGGDGGGGGGGAVNSVPEPSALALVGIGGLVLGGNIWRKKQSTT